MTRRSRIPEKERAQEELNRLRRLEAAAEKRRNTARVTAEQAQQEYEAAKRLREHASRHPSLQQGEQTTVPMPGEETSDA